MGINMNKTIALIAILIISILALAGCRTVIIQVPAEEDTIQASTAAKSTSTKSTSKATSTKTATSTGTKTETKEGLRVATTSGNTVGLTKEGTQYRDKNAAESCDIGTPFSCAKYTAIDGLVYLTFKVQSYQSTVEQVDVYLDDQLCSPSKGKIEPGQNKDFMCGIPTTMSDVVNSNLKIQYYNNIERMNKQSLGSVVVKIT